MLHHRGLRDIVKSLWLCVFCWKSCCYNTFVQYAVIVHFAQRFKLSPIDITQNLFRV